MLDILAPKLQRNVPLAPYTTFKIGGSADFFYEASSADDLAQAVVAAREAAIPFFLLGLGANILLGDLGFRGLVILNRATAIQVYEERQQVWAESGAVVYPNLIETAVQHALSGLEHYPGIPSTLGGALWQNLHFLSPAPARERTMFIEEIVLSAEILTPQNERKQVDRAYFNFGYDYSTLHDTGDIVLSARLQLSAGNPDQMRQVIAENLRWRNEKHPPLAEEPSAGSIFKKIEGIGAGRLIDQCGLKGHQIGGAKISTKHANFIVNTGNATASDVLRLIDLVVTTVEAKYGLRLETEIGRVGAFAPM